MTISHQNIKYLQEYYTGKICSVFLNSLERSILTEIRNIDSDGVWGQHPENRTALFIPMSQIAMIAEEVVLDPSNPKDAEIIDDYKRRNNIEASDTPIVSRSGGDSQVADSEVAFVDISQLSNLAKQTKLNYDNLSKIGTK